MIQVLKRSVNSLGQTVSITAVAKKLQIGIISRDWIWGKMKPTSSNWTWQVRMKDAPRAQGSFWRLDPSPFTPQINV